MTSVSREAGSFPRVSAGLKTDATLGTNKAYKVSLRENSCQSRRASPSNGESAGRKTGFIHKESVGCGSSASHGANVNCVAGLNS